MHILLHYGIQSNIVLLIYSMCEWFRSQIQTFDKMAEEFQTSVGILHECILFPHMVNCFYHRKMPHVEATNGAITEGVVIERHPLGHPSKCWKENFFNCYLPVLLRMAQNIEQYRLQIHLLLSREALRRPIRPDGTSVK